MTEEERFREKIRGFGYSEEQLLEFAVRQMGSLESQRKVIEALQGKIKDLEIQLVKTPVVRVPVVEVPVVKRKGLFGGKKTPTPIIDTETQVVYHSKAACGKLLATMAGTDPKDHFAWYKLLKAFPKRFREATSEEVELAKKTGVYKQVKLL